MSSTIVSAVEAEGSVPVLRSLSAATAAVIVVDAASVGAPGLGLMAVPFLVAALGLRTARRAACTALAIWGLIYAGICLAYIISHGFDAPWGDLVGVYVGLPLSAAVVGFSMLRLVRRSD